MDDRKARWKKWMDAQVNAPVVHTFRIKNDLGNHIVQEWGRTRAEARKKVKASGYQGIFVT